MTTSTRTIIDRATATLRLVDELVAEGNLRPAVAAALRNSLGGVLVPPSAVSSPDVERAVELARLRDQVDELRDAAAAHLVAPNVDTAQRLADLLGGGA